MRRIFNNLFRDFRTAKTARPARRASRRANLHVECVEERMLMASARVLNGTLTVTADPGVLGKPFPGRVPPPIIEQINFEADAHRAGLLDVSQGTTSLGQFPIASIKNVKVNLVRLDNVNVIDSNGLPFAHGITISLSGTNDTDNSLTVAGSRSITGNETYNVGATAAQASRLSLDGLTFLVNNTVGSVTDSVEPEGGSLTVVTDGQDVSLAGSNGVTQTLSGLGLGGGGTFTFSHQNLVALDQGAAHADVVLDATAAVAGEHSFNLVLTNGPNDEVFIKATPSTVTTSVNAVQANNAFVYLLSNSAPVSIAGNTSTNVGVGGPPDGLGTTTTINANVSVSGVGNLNLADNGNTKTQENVTVNESKIFGTGLFGKNAVQLTYSNTGDVSFSTGQLQDTYNVAASTTKASFSSKISIFDFSRVGLSVGPTLDANTNLDMNLVNSFTEPKASLEIVALGARFSTVPPTMPTGVEDVTFPDGDTSTVAYQNYASVGLLNGSPNR